MNRPQDLANLNSKRRQWQSFLASRLTYKLSIQAKTHIEIALPVEHFDHGLHLNSVEGDKGGRENHIALKPILTHEDGKHKIAVGFGIGRRKFDAQKQYFESDKPLLEESLDGTLIEKEIFIEDIVEISNSLSVLFGIRYDQVNYSEFYEPENQVKIVVDDLSQTTIRFAVTKQINEKRTLKISYQEGFRYPDAAYFLYHGLGNDGLRDAGLEEFPKLKAETVESYEINYLHENINIPLAWEFNFYYNIHTGTLDFKDYSEEELGTARHTVARAAIGFGPGAYANSTGSFKAIGFEIVNRWRPLPSTHIRSSYAYSRSKGFETGINTNLLLANKSNNNWASYPKHLFKLALNQKLGDSVVFNLTTYYGSAVDICVTDCETKSRCFSS